ncbi:MAG: Chaperone SurA [bacterium]|nr:Chaperone SurA [bacterium]
MWMTFNKFGTTRILRGLAAISCVLTSSSAAQTLDRVVASVNGSVITLRELNQKVQDLNRLYARPDSPTKGKVPPEGAVKRRAIEDLIEEELIVNRLKGDLREETAARFAEKTVDEQLDQLRKQVGEAEFRARLAQESQTVEEFRAAMIADRKRQILVQQARQAWIDEYLLTPVSQAQVDKYLEEHKGVLEEGGAPEVQFVFLRIPDESDPAAVEAVQRKAEKVLARARVGEPFEQLVEEFSQHDQSKGRKGFLDLISPTNPFPEFAPLFELDAGQVNPQVIRITGWFCIAKVKSKQSIYNLVRRRIALEEQRKALEELKKSAIIVYDREVFPATTP